MAEQRITMVYPPIEDLLDVAGSKFTLVTLASKRGREINSYFNQLGEGLGAIIPPQVASIARKPLTIALEEIAAGKVLPFFEDEEEIADEEKADTEVFESALDDETETQIATTGDLGDKDVVSEDDSQVKDEDLAVDEDLPLDAG